MKKLMPNCTECGTFKNLHVIDEAAYICMCASCLISKQKKSINKPEIQVTTEQISDIYKQIVKLSSSIIALEVRIGKKAESESETQELTEDRDANYDKVEPMFTVESPTHLNICKLKPDEEASEITSNYYSLAEASIMLSISRSTLRRYYYKGRKSDALKIGSYSKNAVRLSIKDMQIIVDDFSAMHARYVRPSMFVKQDAPEE